MSLARLQGLDPQLYRDEVMRVLSYWPKERHLELVPKYWAATRAKLNPSSSKPGSARSRVRAPRCHIGPANGGRSATKMGVMQRLLHDVDPTHYLREAVRAADPGEHDRLPSADVW
ncbi:MAG: hypothetical protein ACOY0T_39925 [Myxococcota bacterium]